MRPRSTAGTWSSKRPLRFRWSRHSRPRSPCAMSLSILGHQSAGSKSSIAKGAFRPWSPDQDPGQCAMLSSSGRIWMSFWSGLPACRESIPPVMGNSPRFPMPASVGPVGSNTSSPRVFGGGPRHFEIPTGQESDPSMSMSASCLARRTPPERTSQIWRSSLLRRAFPYEFQGFAGSSPDFRGILAPSSNWPNITNGNHVRFQSAWRQLCPDLHHAYRDQGADGAGSQGSQGRPAGAVFRGARRSGPGSGIPKASGSPAGTSAARQAGPPDDRRRPACRG